MFNSRALKKHYDVLVTRDHERRRENLRRELV